MDMSFDNFEGIYEKGKSVGVEGSISVAMEVPISPPDIIEVSSSTHEEDYDVPKHHFCFDTKHLSTKDFLYYPFIKVYQKDINRRLDLIELFQKFTSIDALMIEAMEEYFKIIPNIIIEVAQVEKINKLNDIGRKSQQTIENAIDRFYRFGEHQFWLMQKLKNMENNIEIESNLKLRSRQRWRRIFTLILILSCFIHVMTLDRSMWMQVVLYYFAFIVFVDKLIDNNISIYKQNNEWVKKVIGGLQEISLARITYIDDIKAELYDLKDEVNPIKLDNKKVIVTKIKKMKKVKRSFEELVYDSSRRISDEVRNLRDPNKA